MFLEVSGMKTSRLDGDARMKRADHTPTRCITHSQTACQAASGGSMARRVGFFGLLGLGDPQRALEHSQKTYNHRPAMGQLPP